MPSTTMDPMAASGNLVWENVLLYHMIGNVGRELN